MGHADIARMYASQCPDCRARRAQELAPNALSAAAERRQHSTNKLQYCNAARGRRAMGPRSKLQPRRRAGVLNVAVWAAMAMAAGLAESASIQPQRRLIQRGKQAQNLEQAQASACTGQHATLIGPHYLEAGKSHCMCTFACIGPQCSSARMRTAGVDANKASGGAAQVHGYNPSHCPSCRCSNTPVGKPEPGPESIRVPDFLESIDRTERVRCEADGSWYSCAASRCRHKRPCTSNSALLRCACPWPTPDTTASTSTRSPSGGDQSQSVGRTSQTSPDREAGEGRSQPAVGEGPARNGSRSIPEYSNRTVVSLADTYNPPPAKSLPRGWEGLDYRQITAVLAYEYARRHGYDFSYLAYRGPDDCDLDPDHGCFHPRYGSRHSAWAKVLAIAWQLHTRNYPSLVQLDSDMAIIAPAITPSEHLALNHTCGSVWAGYPHEDGQEFEMRGTKQANYGYKSIHCATDACTATKRRAVVAMPHDMSPDVAVNSGLSFWNFFAGDRRRSTELIADWWRAGKGFKGFPWEQMAMNAGESDHFTPPSQSHAS